MPFNRRLGRPPVARPEYLLRATFDVADQGYADDQVIDIRDEGILDGKLTIVEDDGTLAIVGKKCAFTAQAHPATWGDLGFYSQGITRALGRGLFYAINIGATGAALIGHGGFQTSTAPANPDNQVTLYWRGDSGTLRLFSENVSTADIASYSGATEYQIALILGGYHNTGVPWRSGQVAANYLYGVAAYIKGGAFTNWTLLGRDASGNTTTLYGVFVNQRLTGTIDNFRIPDVDLSAVLQPNNLSLFASAGELSAYTPELGSVWGEDIGDWDTAGGVLQATALGIASFTGLADCLYDAKITMPGSGTTAGGLVLRETDLTGASEDYWYVKITPGTASTDWELIEYAAGAATQRASGDVDWSVSTAYAVRAICDGQDIACFADGGDKISYASAASGETATSFGLRDEGNANMTFDNVALFARTSSVYTATLDGV